MVEVYRAPSLGQSMSNSLDAMGMSNKFMGMNLDSIQEERPEKEQGSKDTAVRIPRRAFTSTEHIPVSFASIALQTQRQLISPSQTPRETAGLESHFQPQRRDPLASIPSKPGDHRQAFKSPLSPSDNHAVKRPVLPGPQRSYSVMDVEPIPFTHQPGVILTLPDLPAELHYSVFDFLDPIDSTCLALTSRHFYAIHRQIHGRVSLAARRKGPNDMEWVWRHAGPFVAGGSGGGGGKHNALATLSPRGQVYCRKCRTSRCELHNHIKEWVGDGLEYCEVSQKFGAPAADGAKPVCYRSSPRHPHRCGRHTRQQRAVRLV